MSASRRSVVRFLPLVLLLVATMAVLASGLHRYLSFEGIVAHREYLRGYVSQHYAAALALYAVVYVGVVALSLPGGLVLTILGGFLFGWSVGGGVAVVAATVGATIVFLAARTSLGAVLAARAGPALQRIARGFRENAVFYLLFLRLVPVFPFWLVNLAPALFGVPLATYVATTIVGILPATFAFAFAGAGLDNAVEAHRAAYEACLAAGQTGCRLTMSKKALVNRELIVALVALGFLALLPVALKRLFGRKLSGLDGGNAVS
ncbi:VTT domain-containing protein [Chelatococcus sp. SYSU_G07232]|uniref:TVP38/TMEM64 family membrane protein n=1 Tax=Chelatococcus albus TaxID=3047466 RepID=A0ABT7AEA2_9HYPH|nr:VTT domain-containing protein [Chelatococcus sp. SYSU_G07232]MDJ1157697.1 VTT domain-containing protein [Chelatococcus sp. SYSU_G07232]